MVSNLHLRLILTHLGVLLAGLLLLGLAFAAILSNRVTAAHESDLRYETSALTQQLDRALATNVPNSVLQRTIRRDSALMGKRIILLDSRGRARYDSSRWTPFSRGSWRLVDLAALRHGRWSHLNGSDRFGWQVPLTLHGHLAGAVALVVTASDAAVPWQQILPALLAVFSLILLAWLLIGAHLVRSLVRPLRHVTHALVLVKGGRYDQPVLEEGWTETRELARRYNEMVAEVAHSHQTLRDFMANAAHELKTPVALVSGFARSLNDGTAARGDAVTEAVGYIQTESDHLARIVDQLLSLASLDADTDALATSPCAPAELLAHVASRFSRAALQEGKALSWSCDEALPDCRWDAQRIESALTNLVSNSLDYTERGDTITVEVTAHGSRVALQVRDTGSGIAATELPHVFDRFYRGGSSSRNHGHAGLGLALVREIAHRHDGEVAVESRPGAGSCFTLSLPIDGPHAGQVALHRIHSEEQQTA